MIKIESWPDFKERVYKKYLEQLSSDNRRKPEVDMQEQIESERKSLKKKNAGADGKLIITSMPNGRKFNAKATELEAVTAQDGTWSYYLLHLTDNLVGTVIAKGAYEGTDSENFKGKPMLTHNVRTSNGDLFKIKGCKALNEQFAALKGLEGINVEVTFDGAKQTKNGDTFYDFNVTI